MITTAQIVNKLHKGYGHAQLTIEITGYNWDNKRDWYRDRITHTTDKMYYLDDLTHDDEEKRHLAHEMLINDALRSNFYDKDEDFAYLYGNE